MASSPELLTELEHSTIGLLGMVFRNITEIAKDSKIPGDLEEAASKIHDLQHMVMAQAAARAYPEHYRLLGQRLIK
jgi:hypothetical protein